MNQHDLDVLDEIQRRVLWLATRIVDAANHDRDTGDGVKVGGHQASSASLVTAMTALWFAHLDAEDRVAVKPHASPVFHAVQYLLGNLDRSYLPKLRARGGLQSYPSRTKDPDGVDFSTGSVGLGAAAPLFAAVTRRYVDAHFGERTHSRFIALIGDAELDEGNIWEAVADPATTGLGNVMWLVDFNRQSLDRVVPGVRINQWRGQFEAAGWHVVEVKYGRKLAEAYERPGGAALRDWIDLMPNEQYQSLFGLAGPALRKQFLDGAPAEVAAFVADIPDDELGPLVTDLGGHDLQAMLDAYAQCDAVTDRPSVVFAYTVKGWGLPIAGNPRNHSALLTSEQVDALRAAHGLTRDTEWDRLDPASPAGIRAGERREALARAPRERALGVTVPETTKVRVNKPVSTQEVFGRVLVDLARDPKVAPYLVTTAPDVATSTNLAGFINKTGVFAPTEQRSWTEDRMLRWTETPAGQHIELGISEMNLFLLLGQLGLSWDLSGQPLLPVGTVYDPFVLRGLDAFLYGTYSGSRFVVAGTPSGITLAPEGGAHQSTITASVGLELPGVTFCEPAYAGSLDWLLCDALGQIAGGAAPAATAAPATIATSRHIVPVGSACAPTSWSASTAYDRGSTSLIAWSQPAISPRGTNSPQSSSWGATTTGMNCTAWNSVRAKALQNRPSATASTALIAAIMITSPMLPAVVRPNTQYATAEATVAWTTPARPNAMPYPKSRSSLASGVVSSRSSVPVVRSRSMAMLVTRNMMMNGKKPSMISATRSKTVGRPGGVGWSTYMK
ncbi:hypothetical protein GCM10027452_09310 [Micromonospora halotolerans]